MHSAWRRMGRPCYTALLSDCLGLLGKSTTLTWKVRQILKGDLKQTSPFFVTGDPGGAPPPLPMAATLRSTTPTSSGAPTPELEWSSPQP